MCEIVTGPFISLAPRVTFIIFLITMMIIMIMILIIIVVYFSPPYVTVVPEHSHDIQLFSGYKYISIYLTFNVYTFKDI